MAANINLDVRGLSCPEPVIRTRRMLALGTLPLTVLADHVVAAENIKRLAKSMYLLCTIYEELGEYTITITNEV
jgi:tRNA 2-thiouridine synthesizing protein A